jgi:hypothetical protein
VYRDLRDAQGVSISVQMPLVTWGARSARIETVRAHQVRGDQNARQTRSLRSYWLAYYRLRRTTLFDFELNESIR